MGRLGWPCGRRDDRGDHDDGHRGDVGRIKSPLLLIGAGKVFAASPVQKKMAQQAYEAQAARVPAHEVVFAENALHFVMYDDLQFLLETMDAFLQRVWPPAPGTAGQR